MGSHYFWGKSSPRPAGSSEPRWLWACCRRNRWPAAARWSKSLFLGGKFAWSLGAQKKGRLTRRSTVLVDNRPSPVEGQQPQPPRPMASIRRVLPQEGLMYPLLLFLRTVICRNGPAGKVRTTALDRVFRRPLRGQRHSFLRLAAVRRLRGRGWIDGNNSLSS